MDEKKEIVIHDPHGLHMRVASEIVRIALRHDDTTVCVRKAESQADGRSIIELLLLEAAEGERLEVEAKGAHAKTVLRMIGEIFDDGAGI